MSYIMYKLIVENAYQTSFISQWVVQLAVEKFTRGSYSILMKGDHSKTVDNLLVFEYKVAIRRVI